MSRAEKDQEAYERTEEFLTPEYNLYVEHTEGGITEAPTIERGEPGLVGTQVFRKDLFVDSDVWPARISLTGLNCVCKHVAVKFFTRGGWAVIQLSPEQLRQVAAFLDIAADYRESIATELTPEQRRVFVADVPVGNRDSGLDPNPGTKQRSTVPGN